MARYGILWCGKTIDDPCSTSTTLVSGTASTTALPSGSQEGRISSSDILWGCGSPPSTGTRREDLAGQGGTWHALPGSPPPPELFRTAEAGEARAHRRSEELGDRARQDHPLALDLAHALVFCGEPDSMEWVAKILVHPLEPGGRHQRCWTREGVV